MKILFTFLLYDVIIHDKKEQIYVLIAHIYVFLAHFRGDIMTSTTETIRRAYPVREQIHITDMYSFFQVHYENGYEFPGETHDFWECLYVLDGEVCVSADERVYNMSQGEIIFHSPLELHKFFVNGDTGATLLIFSFSAEGPLTISLRNKVFLLSDIQKGLIETMLHYLQTKASSINPSSDMPIFSFTQPSPSDISQLKTDLFLQLFHKLPYYSQMLVSYLHQLFLSLAEEGTISTASSAADAVTFRKAIGYLNHNLHRQPTVSEVAHYCNLSDASLKRLFEKYAGIGVHKYLTKLKIKAAMELLEEKESVANVAEKLGFTSQSYFSKAFKRETGMNPSEIFVK